MIAATAGPRRGGRLEWSLALAAAAASAALVCWVGRETWFRLDVWEFLTAREAGDFASWVRPHAGHLQWVAVGLHRLLYGAVGLDFWPWYFLPHVLGHAALSLLLWRVLLRRGADRGLALAVYLVVLFLGVSAFLSSIAIGGLLVLALLLLVAQRLDAAAAPRLPEKALVALALAVMATSSSLGVAGVAGCLAAVVLTRSLRRWWWCFLPAAAAYGAWYAVWGGRGQQGRVHWSYLVKVPGDALTLLGNATSRLIGFDGGGVAVGAVVAAALAGGLGWLAWKGRLRRWDLVFVGALGAYLVMLTLVRGGAGKVSLDTTRYSYPVVMLAVPLVAPHLRLPARWPAGVRTAVLILLASGVVGLNAWQRGADTAAIARETSQGRVAISTVGQWVAAGEPAVDSIHLRYDLGIGMAGQLTIADVRGLLADGWEPAPAGLWERADQVQGLLRLNLTGRRNPAPGPPALLFAGETSEGCVAVPPGAERRFTVAAAGQFYLQPAGQGEPGSLSLVWRDGFGEFPREIVVTDRTAVAAAAPPAGGAVLSVFNGGERRLSVCKVAAGA